MSRRKIWFDLKKHVLRKEKKNLVINGCWSGRIPICEKCKKKMILCPKEGHPNSKYWELQRDDGMLLYVCSNNCLEE